MEFEKGYGYQGVLLFDGASDKIQCHFCGNWYGALANHIAKEHNMRVAEYKETVGLGKNTALISESMRASLIAAGLDKRLQNLRKRGKKTEEEKEKIRKGMKKFHATREGQNIKGTCPKQLLERLDAKCKELGRMPTETEFNLLNTIRKVYGMKEACKLIGVEYRKPGQNLGKKVGKYTEQSLIDAIVSFYKLNGRYPSTSDSKRGFIPSNETYKRKFGSWKNALKEATKIINKHANR